MLQKVLKNTYEKIRKERKAKQMVVSYNGITEKQKVQSKAMNQQALPP